MARNGPGDDFHNQPTQHADWGMGGHPPSGEQPPIDAPPSPSERFEQPEPVDPFDALDRETEPTPWYRRPAMLVGWVVLVVILIGLIIFGVLELMNGGQGTSNNPTTSTNSTTTTTTTTTPPTTTTPSSSSEVAPPPQQPQQQPQQPQQTQQPQLPPRQQPTHSHHLPHLPSVITIPQVPTVITLPPGLP